MNACLALFRRQKVLRLAAQFLEAPKLAWRVLASTLHRVRCIADVEVALESTAMPWGAMN